MKTIKRNFLITVIVVFLILLSFLPYNFIFSKAEEVTISDAQVSSVEDYSLTASIWNNSQYDEKEADLIEEGVKIEGWEAETSKYLQINPTVPADGNTYFVSVILPEEFYIVGSELVTPAGYQSVEFTKNEDIVINDNCSVELNKYSGTAIYTLNNMGISGTIQLEICYDVRLWDKQEGSSITPDGVIPITIALSQKDSLGNITELKRICVSKVTAGSANVDVFGLSLTIDDTSTSSQIIALQDKYVTIAQSINNNSGTARYKLYSSLVTTISLPYYTHSDGTKYYIPIDESSISFGNSVKYTSYTIDTTALKEEGKITIIFENPYWYTGTLISFKVGILQQELINISDINEFKFSSGTITHTVDSRNGTTGIKYSTFSLGTIIYQKDVTEKVVLTRNNKTVTIIERPDNAVSLLGGFYLENTGTGDSSGKNININFDIDNTNRVKVTTINIMADSVQQYTDVKYTLVDENGVRVYLDENGNRVEETDENAIGEWVYSLENSFYGSTVKVNLRNTLTRSMLPPSHQSYYFKSVSYRIEKITSKTLLYAKSATSSLKSAGNFLGYVDDVNGINKQTAKHTILVVSDNKGIANLTNTSTTTLETSSKPTYIVNDTYLKMNQTKIQAGESLIATGRISAVDYPYGNCTWLKGITIGAVLPTAVSLNEQAIIIKNASGKIIADYTVSTENIGNGNVLWKIKLPKDVYIGVATESIGTLNSGLYIDFSVQLDTSYTMNGTTLFAKDIFFAAGYNQTNSASGSYAWSSSVDIYDLNENGSTTDKIACTRSTVTTSCQIVAQTATLDVVDSVSIERQGSITSESSEGTLLTKDDIVNYNLDIACLSGGQTEDFLYFIPVPKKASIVDNFLIEESSNGRFDLVLKEFITISKSDIFIVKYSFEEGLTYASAQNESLTWYSEEEIRANSLDIKDITMIKLTVNGDGISNGEEIRATAKFVYGGETYLSDTGLENIWHSGGFYKYVNSDRESAGNFSTEGTVVNISEIVESEDIVLTAAKNMEPQIEGNVITAEFDNSVLTNFVNSHTFYITDVETYNVNLKTKDYILDNTDMPGIEANQTFAITVKMADGKECDILTSAVTNPIEIGTSLEGEIPEFTFNIYNADAITDNVQTRYIKVVLASNNGITIIQKININREIAEASDPQSAIVAGKRYITFDDVTTGITISEDSAFTAQFIMEYIPALYSNQEIVFSSALPSGTNIVLENLTFEPTYWYYRNEESKVSKVSLSDFKSMGTTGNNNYVVSDSIDLIEEKLLIIVDFSNCKEYLKDGNYSIKMDIAGTTDDVDGFSTENLKFSTVSKSEYTLNVISDVCFEEEFDINYSIDLTSGAASKYEGRKLSMILTAPNNIPTDTHLIVNNITYHLNQDKQFIIPFGDIVNGSNSVKFKIVSDMLSTNESSYNFTATLWISATANSEAPKLGEIVGTQSFIVKHKGILTPSLKVENMNKRVIHRNDLANTFSLVFEYIEAEGCTATVELQQKIGTAYQKVTDRLNQVNNMTEHKMGVYNITAINGKNEIKFNLSSAINNYTYRLVIKVYAPTGEELLEIPYVFVVTE